MTDEVTSDSYRDLSDAGVHRHNTRMIALLRANGGRLPGVPDSEMLVLILTITGAKSGMRRPAPLGYVDFQGRRYIAGSNGGQESPPAWIVNVRANPSVVAEVDGETYEAELREVTAGDRDGIFAMLTSKHPFFGEYQAKIRRTIPIFELVRS